MRLDRPTLEIIFLASITALFLFDIALSLANIAKNNNYVQPIISNNDDILIKNSILGFFSTNESKYLQT
mgnify:CR=1 FL=1